MSHHFKDDGRPFPFSPALRQALITADGAHRASLEVLRDAICAYVEDLRDQGIPAQDIVGALRHRVADLDSSDGMARLGSGARGIVDEMVESCLEGGEYESSAR